MPATSNKTSKRSKRRVKITVTTMVAGVDHVLAMDIPSDYWSLEDLHELARSVATTAGILGDYTSAISVDITYPDPRDSRGRRR
jgi:hypothetical protein